MATVAALALVVAACGSDDSGSSGNGAAVDASDAVQLIASSPDRLTEARSARFSITVTTEGSAGLQGDIAMEGAVDLENQNMVLQMDLSQLGIPGAEGTFEARMVDGVMYMDVGAMASQMDGAMPLPDGVKWLSLDVNEAAGGASGSPAAEADLTSSFEALRGVSDEVEEVGREDVRGTETTHYRIEIDPAKALDDVPEDQRADAEQALSALGDQTLTADVWIDDDGLMRKMTMPLDLSSAASELSGEDVQVTSTFTMELWDFGTDVDVSAPPADETVDMMQMFQGFLPGGTQPA